MFPSCLSYTEHKQRFPCGSGQTFLPKEDVSFHSVTFTARRPVPLGHQERRLKTGHLQSCPGRPRTWARCRGRRYSSLPTTLSDRRQTTLLGYPLGVDTNASLGSLRSCTLLWLQNKIAQHHFQSSEIH